MKNKVFLIIIPLLTILSCKELLVEKQFSSLGPSTFYNKTEDIEAILYSAYRIDHQLTYSGYTHLHAFAEATTDIMFQYGGGLNRNFVPLLTFTWDASYTWFNNVWTECYVGISSANLVLSEIPDMPISDNDKNIIIGEAQFLRANLYYRLYELFGPVPLIIDADFDATENPNRATDQEIKSFIEEEFLAAIGNLPAEAKAYGRANKGAAISCLSSYYLNTKQWQKAADAAQQVMELGKYSLFKVSNRTDLFIIDNEKNSEFIYVRPYTNVSGYAHNYFPRVVPPQYKFQYPPNENFGAQYTVYTEWYNTFAENDERREAIITEYINLEDELVQLDPEANDYRDLKIVEDPNANDRQAGNDIPIMRYAEILLIRSEALNEINGLNQESVELINKVREAAGIELYQLSDFSSQQQFRDVILQERGWEFHFENKRRQDLIRHGKFVEYAHDRGISAASDFHTLFPIPQQQIDLNPNLTQNEGYAN